MKSEIIFVAVDFVVNQKGKLFFIELNNFPSISPEYKKIIGNYKPIEELVKLAKKEPFILIYNNKKWRESQALRNLYKSFESVTNGNCELLLWSKKLGNGFDIGRLKSKKGLVYTPNPDIRQMFVGNKNYEIVNQKRIRDICRDKKKAFNLLKTKISEHLPQTFEFTNFEELKDIFAKIDFKKFVIKPRYGSKGNGVHILDNQADAFKIDISQREHWLLQEKIDNFDKTRQKYYDIRVYMLNGKPVGAMSRVSKNPIVNISLGGKIEKVTPKFLKQANELAEKIYRIVFESEK